jgi:hypothetical protein
VRDDLPDWPRLESLLLASGARIAETGEVTVVGPGIGADPTLIARVLALVSPLVPHPGVRAAPQSVTVAVPPGVVDETVRTLHEALVIS